MIFINPQPVFESIDFEVDPLLDVIGLNEQLTESYVSLGKPKEMEQVLEFSFKKIWDAVKRFFRNLIDKIRGFFSRKKKEHQQKSEEIKKTLADADKRVEELNQGKSEENKSDLKVGDEKPGSRQVLYTPKNNSIIDKDKDATYQRSTDGKIIKSYSGAPTFDKKPPKFPTRYDKKIEKKVVSDRDLYNLEEEEVYEYNFYKARLWSYHELDLLHPVKYFDEKIKPDYDTAFNYRMEVEKYGEDTRRQDGKNYYGRDETPFGGEAKYKHPLEEARKKFDQAMKFVGTTEWLKSDGLLHSVDSSHPKDFEPITSEYIKGLVKSKSKVKMRLDKIKSTLLSYEKETDKWDKRHQKYLAELNKIQAETNGELTVTEKIAKEKDTIGYDISVEEQLKRKLH